jgi:hypothetical protein
MAQTEMTTVHSETSNVSKPSDAVFYGVAVLLGVLSGILQVALQDRLLTSLLVTASTMFLGFTRPLRPWRWTLLVTLLVPAVMIAANLMHFYGDVSRAGMYGAALIILPGFAGAYGGHFGRGFLRTMFGMK